jgi:beta-N-acetylhexosaminidase
MNAEETAFNVNVKSIVERCLFGFDPAMFEANTPAAQLADLNPLGYIFFRHHFAGCASLADVRDLINQVKARHRQPLFLGLDQEGGQVERLPSQLFHGGLSPFTVGEVERLNPKSGFAQRYYDWQSQGLASLGFNLNFFPTLDAHLNPQNPIIGNRAFSSDPAEIKRLGQLAKDAQSTYGIQSVLKHYPGHGSGTVDSHLALPTLDFTEAEESCFVALMHDLPLPWVMLAHGVYPNLTDASQHIPASCDPYFVTNRLRKHWGFTGLTITDDLNMHGLLQAFEGDQGKASLQALEAGVDVLLFREAGLHELNRVKALATALEEGRLNREKHLTSVARVNLAQKTLQQIETTTPEQLLPLEWHQAIEALHEEAMETILADYTGILTLEATCIVEPHATLLPHYAMEYVDGSLTSAFLPDSATRLTYETAQALSVHQALNTGKKQVLAFVWLPQVGKPLLQALEALHASGESASVQTVVVVNLGTPIEGEYPLFTFINLGTARPPTLQTVLARLFSP